MAEYSVYIVDDKKLIRESLEKTVDWAAHDFQVVGSAGDGITAEEEIRRLRPNVVISDIRMPGKDGFELSRKVAQILPETKVIIITGFDRFEYAQKSLRVGAVDVILKPIRNEDIEAALQKAKGLIEQGRLSQASAVADFLETPEHEDLGHLTKAVVEYIEQNYHRDISLSSIADMYRITPSHLSKVFKKETGTTFLKYLNSRRVEKACILLSDPAYRIAEIADACGFSSPLHLTKVFKQLKGQTPRDYRNNL